MKILIVTQYFWPERFRINEFALDLCKQGHEVSVLTGLPNYPSGRFYDDYGIKNLGKDHLGEIEIIRVPLIPRGNGNFLFMSLNYISFAYFACLLGPFLFRKQVDLIFAFEPSPITVAIPAILFKKLKCAPLLLWVQDLWPESVVATKATDSRQIITLLGSLVRYIYKRCDRILIQSRAFEKSVIDYGGNKEHIYYFPNSAEEVYMPLDEQTCNKKIHDLPNGFKIIFAGNIGVAQSLETIVKAAKLLEEFDDIHWVIFGDGRFKSQLQQLVVENGLQEKIILPGERPVEDMPAYFALADALLVSLRDEYIFSLTIPAKVQSYLACAKPVIACLNGEGARVIEESGAGYCAPAEDATGLAKAVLKLYNLSVDARRNMGKKGREYYDENFSKPVLANRLEKIFKELIV